MCQLLSNYLLFINSFNPHSILIIHTETEVQSHNDQPWTQIQLVWLWTQGMLNICPAIILCTPDSDFRLLIIGYVVLNEEVKQIF